LARARLGTDRRVNETWREPWVEGSQPSWGSWRGSWPGPAVARVAGITQRFSLKVLGPLVRAGVLDAVRGPGGGYRLARPAADTTLLEVVEAVVGPLRSKAPGVNGAANDKLKSVCQRAAGWARELLAKVSVPDLAKAMGGA
jgi:Rrf2 family protein